MKKIYAAVVSNDFKTFVSILSPYSFHVHNSKNPLVMIHTQLASCFIKKYCAKLYFKLHAPPKNS